MKKLLICIISALGALTCEAQMDPLDFAEYKLDKRAIDGETARDWFKRNHVTGPPIENSIDFEPNAPLIATSPFVEPRLGDEGYNDQWECKLGPIKGTNKVNVRLYRRGVFVGYVTIEKVEQPPMQIEGMA
jgi:hypothetical protein